MAEPAETPAQRRRRWINFGEIVGVLALLVSAASLWDSHQSRVAETVAARPTPAPVHPLVLTAVPDGDARILKISAAAGDAVIQTQTVLFPKGAGRHRHRYRRQCADRLRLVRKSAPRDGAQG